MIESVYLSAGFPRMGLDDYIELYRIIVLIYACYSSSESYVYDVDSVIS